MAAQLAQLVRITGLRRTMAVGELILNQFFGGQADAWRVRRRNKSNSVRRLAERPGCPLSRSALNQAVGVHVTVRALPCVQTFGHIGASHVVAVLPLSPLDQERWLRRAETDRWSVRSLKAQIVAAGRLAGERRGRPKATDTKRALAQLVGSIGRLQGAAEMLSDAGSPESSVVRAVEESLEKMVSIAGVLRGLCRRSFDLSAFDSDDRSVPRLPRGRDGPAGEAVVRKASVAHSPVRGPALRAR